ncbi:MAG: hypothetical protein GY775_07945 [Candidatus Scalindua sp.]|nr:hypothetical protein [Candidatus Scalindua sp.]
MNIDYRDIQKGLLPKILSNYYPNSISYLRELNEYRMYAEIWSNNRNKAWQKRKEIGHEGYLKTLAMGETVKRRKVDKVRFNFFIVADSVNYCVKGRDYRSHIILGAIQSNVIFNNIIKENQHLLKMQSQFPSAGFHAEEFIPEPLEIRLFDLDLQKNPKDDKCFFEILTNATEISNVNQEMILLHAFGNDAISKKLPLLYKSNRKAIRFLFEDPIYIEKGMNTRNTISRACVACSFDETIVIDFAASLDDYKEICLLGTPLKQTDLADSRKWYEKIIS